MDLNTVAARMNGKEYGEHEDRELFAEAKAEGIVILFGASDDLMEFRGAIYDEIGACDDGFAYLNPEGLVLNECESDDCPHYVKAQDKAAIIEAKWCPPTGESWAYVTKIPHITFQIMEDGDVYCTGITFRLSDVT